MPVHFKVAPHGAKQMDYFTQLDNAEQLLDKTWGVGTTTVRNAELLQTSYTEMEYVVPKLNGFVNTVTEAYNQHRHLIIRPDDVWMAILSQFNYYVNAHAEDLRHKFVTHEGKKRLTVKAPGSRYTVDFGALAVQMSTLIDEKIVDKDLKEWILPDFTTTTMNDTIICAVYMMSTLQEYFSYGIDLICGIPSVTLEGEKSDWEKLLSRIDKLKDFGAETEAWAYLLRPILRRFVNAFDGNPDIEFWEKVCHYQHHGSGASYLSGWITAFCVWDSKGRCSGSPSSAYPSRLSQYEDPEEDQLFLDGVEYGTIETDRVPSGYSQVDVDLDDNGAKFDCMMVSGHMGMKVEGEKKDTVRPHPGWFMFIKETPG